VRLREVVGVDVNKVECEEPGAGSTRAALKSLESLKGDSAGASHELEQSGPHLGGIPFNYLPEPNHLK